MNWSKILFVSEFWKRCRPVTHILRKLGFSYEGGITSISIPKTDKSTQKLYSCGVSNNRLLYHDWQTILDSFKTSDCNWILRRFIQVLNGNISHRGSWRKKEWPRRKTPEITEISFMNFPPNCLYHFKIFSSYCYRKSSKSLYLRYRPGYSSARK